MRLTVKSYRGSGSLRMPKKQRGSDLNGSSFFNSRVFTQALDPSVKRYAQTKRLLARRSLSALEFLCDFTCAGFFASQRLQSSHIRRRPRTPFAAFHKVCPIRSNYSRASGCHRELALRRPCPACYLRVLIQSLCSRLDRLSFVSFQPELWP